MPFTSDAATAKDLVNPPKDRPCPPTPMIGAGVMYSTVAAGPDKRALIVAFERHDASGVPKMINDAAAGRC